MCDFSLKAVKSQPANEQDKLTTHNFGYGTIGLKQADDINTPATAVCVMPGTEIAFDYVPERRFSWYMGDDAQPMPALSRKAIFRQINTDNMTTHHDALEFDNGVTCLLTMIAEGQRCEVVRLPAPPKTEEEAKAQQRLEVVG